MKSFQINAALAVSDRQARDDFCEVKNMTNPANNSQPSAAVSSSAAPISAAWIGGVTTPEQFALMHEADALHGEVRGIIQTTMEINRRVAELTAIGQSSTDYAVKTKAFRELAD